MSALEGKDDAKNSIEIIQSGVRSKSFSKVLSDEKTATVPSKRIKGKERARNKSFRAVIG